MLYIVMLEPSAKKQQDVLLTTDATSKSVFGWGNPLPMNLVQKIFFLDLWALQRHIIETKIPRKKNCAATVPIPTIMFLWAIKYSPDRSAYSAAGN